MRRPLAILAVLAVLGAGIVLLRAATMARDTPVDPRRDLVVVLRAHVVREPPGAIAPMTRALVDVCRLGVDTQLVDDGYRRRDADEFRFVLRPALDHSDRRRLHGCLEDARVEHLQLDVLRLQTVTRPTAPRVASPR